MEFITEKSQQIKDYFALKGNVNTYAFLEAVNSIPSIRTIPHSGQMEIIKAYEERIAPSPESAALGLDFEYKYRFLIAACGRRFGKSVIASILGAQELLIPNSKVLIVSYRLDNCEVIFNHIRKIIKGLGVEMVVERIRDQELELCNGSTLRVASNDNVEARLGSAVSLLIVDEAKLFAEKLYSQTLLPMTLDYYPLSRSILISSPENCWFEDYFNYGQSDDPIYEKYWSINLPSSTNPTLPKGYLENMKKTTPPDTYAQEYLGLFTSAEGRVVREYNKETCLYTEEDYPHYEEWLRNGTVFQSIDGGYSHYFASAWFLYVEEIDTIFLFGEYMQNKTVTSKHADNIKEFEEERGVDVMIRYADPACAQQIADLSEFNLYYNKAEKNTTESVNNINTLFYGISEVTGRPRLQIHKSCTESIRQIQFIQWKVGRDDSQTKEKSTGTKPFLPDKDKNTDWDLFDAIRYGLYSFVKNNRFDVSVMTFGGDSDDDGDPMTEMLTRMGMVKM